MKFDVWVQLNIQQQKLQTSNLKHSIIEKIRVFGEMVALLWVQGLKEAAVRLEQMWGKLCSQYSLSLFCAYPKNSFTADFNASLTHIYCAHSKMIDGLEKAKNEVIYREIVS